MSEYADVDDSPVNKPPKSRHPLYRDDQQQETDYHQHETTRQQPPQPMNYQRTSNAPRGRGRGSNADANPKRKNRKPEMAIYVPRGRRSVDIENPGNSRSDSHTHTRTHPQTDTQMDTQPDIRSDKLADTQIDSRPDNRTVPQMDLRGSISHKRAITSNRKPQSTTPTKPSHYSHKQDDRNFNNDRKLVDDKMNTKQTGDDKTKTKPGDTKIDYTRCLDFRKSGYYDNVIKKKQSLTDDDNNTFKPDTIPVKNNLKTDKNFDKTKANPNPVLQKESDAHINKKDKAKSKGSNNSTGSSSTKTEKCDNYSSEQGSYTSKHTKRPEWDYYDRGDYKNDGQYYDANDGQYYGRRDHYDDDYNYDNYQYYEERKYHDRRDYYDDRQGYLETKSDRFEGLAQRARHGQNSRPVRSKYDYGQGDQFQTSDDVRYDPSRRNFRDEKSDTVPDSGTDVFKPYYCTDDVQQRQNTRNRRLSKSDSVESDRRSDNLDYRGDNEDENARLKPEIRSEKGNVNLKTHADKTEMKKSKAPAVSTDLCHDNLKLLNDYWEIQTRGKNPTSRSSQKAEKASKKQEKRDNKKDGANKNKKSEDGHIDQERKLAETDANTDKCDKTVAEHELCEMAETVITKENNEGKNNQNNDENITNDENTDKTKDVDNIQYNEQAEESFVDKILSSVTEETFNPDIDITRNEPLTKINEDSITTNEVSSFKNIENDDVKPTKIIESRESESKTISDVTVHTNSPVIDVQQLEPVKESRLSDDDLLQMAWLESSIIKTITEDDDFDDASLKYFNAHQGDKARTVNPMLYGYTAQNDPRMTANQLEYVPNNAPNPSNPIAYGNTAQNDPRMTANQHEYPQNNAPNTTNPIMYGNTAHNNPPKTVNPFAYINTGQHNPSNISNISDTTQFQIHSNYPPFIPMSKQNPRKIIAGHEPYIAKSGYLSLSSFTAQQQNIAANAGPASHTAISLHSDSINSSPNRQKNFTKPTPNFNNSLINKQSVPIKSIIETTSTIATSPTPSTGLGRSWQTWVPAKAMSSSLHSSPSESPSSTSSEASALKSIKKTPLHRTGSVGTKFTTNNWNKLPYESPDSKVSAFRSKSVLDSVKDLEIDSQIHTLGKSKSVSPVFNKDSVFTKFTAESESKLSPTPADEQSFRIYSSGDIPEHSSEHSPGHSFKYSSNFRPENVDHIAENNSVFEFQKATYKNLPSNTEDRESGNVILDLLRKGSSAQNFSQDLMQPNTDTHDNDSKLNFPSDPAIIYCQTPHEFSQKSAQNFNDETKDIKYPVIGRYLGSLTGIIENNECSNIISDNDIQQNSNNSLQRFHNSTNRIEESSQIDTTNSQAEQCLEDELVKLWEKNDSNQESDQNKHFTFNEPPETMNMGRSHEKNYDIDVQTNTTSDVISLERSKDNDINSPKLTTEVIEIHQAIVKSDVTATQSDDEKSNEQLQCESLSSNYTTSSEHSSQLLPEDMNKISHVNDNSISDTTDDVKHITENLILSSSSNMETEMSNLNFVVADTQTEVIVSNSVNAEPIDSTMKTVHADMITSQSLTDQIPNEIRVMIEGDVNEVQTQNDFNMIPENKMLTKPTQDDEHVPFVELVGDPITLQETTSSLHDTEFYSITSSQYDESNKSTENTKPLTQQTFVPSDIGTNLSQVQEYDIPTENTMMLTSSSNEPSDFATVTNNDIDMKAIQDTRDDFVMEITHILPPVQIDEVRNDLNTNESTETVENVGILDTPTNASPTDTTPTNIPSTTTQTESEYTNSESVLVIDSDNMNITKSEQPVDQELNNAHSDSETKISQVSGNAYSHNESKFNPENIDETHLDEEKFYENPPETCSNIDVQNSVSNDERAEPESFNTSQPDVAYSDNDTSEPKSIAPIDIQKSSDSETSEPKSIVPLDKSSDAYPNVNETPTLKTIDQTKPECLANIDPLKQDGDEEDDQSDQSSDEDSWFNQFDDHGEFLDPLKVKELEAAVGKVSVVKPAKKHHKSGKGAFKPDDDPDGFNHVLEIYDFAPELVTSDLMSALFSFHSRGVSIQWVDDTHALAVFSSHLVATEAQSMMYTNLKLRPLSQATAQSRTKARLRLDVMLPYKERPQTSAVTAHRMVAGALGVAPNISREQRDIERKKIQEAREKRREMKKSKETAWHGAYGKCAMDDV